MFVGFSEKFSVGDRVAVAVSGGKDSMSLLHFLNAQKSALRIFVLAINVEHGIRGEQSVQDSAFVKKYCDENDIPLLTYTVDAPSFAKTNKLSLEESARKLRYECFFNAIENDQCDKVATAHHLSDNAESLLFNLFRGTGMGGATGINDNYNNKIVRPFLDVTKAQIDQYVLENNVPFVTDETNFDDDYTRNALRLNVIPEIEKVFPEAQKSIGRFTKILKLENEYLDKTALSVLKEIDDGYKIVVPCHQAIFNRACIIALKRLGVTKDWEFIHVTQAHSLIEKQNGASVDLPNGVIATREYDGITFYKSRNVPDLVLPYKKGVHKFYEYTLEIAEAPRPIDLKDGLYLDQDKIPDTAVIRTFAVGDEFTKFGGGTKSLGDFFTDKKVPKRIRNTLPIIADGKKVLAIFSLAISDDVKVDKNTTNIVQLKNER